VEILQLLTGLQREEGLTIVMVTHDPKVAAYAGRQVYLVDGHIASAAEANGSPS
jgi:putative ABC transport system ATP-binding protein